MSDGLMTSLSRVYFHARFSKPFSTHGTWKDVSGKDELSKGSREASGPKIGAWAGYATTASETI